jgi:hypothetical protein
MERVNFYCSRSKDHPTDGGKYGLGDSIMHAFVCVSMSPVNYYINSPPNNTLKEVLSLFSDQADINIIVNNTISYPRYSPWDLFENKIIPHFTTNKFKLYKHSKRYITTQFISKDPRRVIHNPEKLIEKHGEGYDVINLDNQKDMPIEELIGIIKGAEFHLGVNSGMPWAAAVAGKHTKMLSTAANPEKYWAFAMQNFATEVERNLPNIL